MDIHTSETGEGKIRTRRIRVGLVVVLIAIMFVLWYSQLRRDGTVLGVLTEEPCAPPCWQGIAPGDIVDCRQVARQVRRLPGTIFVGCYVDTDYYDTGIVTYVVSWYWGLRDEPNRIRLSEDGKVYSIWLAVDFDLTVAEILQKYGWPHTYTSDRSSMITLRYPAHGFDCRVKFEANDEGEFMLEPTSLVYRVDYYEPRDVRPTDPPGEPESWPGYGKWQSDGLLIP